MSMMSSSLAGGSVFVLHKAIRASNKLRSDANSNAVASCGGWKMFFACVHIVDVLTHAHVGDILMSSPHWLHESICEKHVCYRGRAIFFNRSDDLTRLELSVFAFFRRSTRVCVSACRTHVCAFPSSRRTRPVGASCDPTGPEVCVFLTNLQPTAKPQATLHTGVELVLRPVPATQSAYVSNCSWCTMLAR